MISFFDSLPWYLVIGNKTVYLQQWYGGTKSQQIPNLTYYCFKDIIQSHVSHAHIHSKSTTILYSSVMSWKLLHRLPLLPQTKTHTQPLCGFSKLLLSWLPLCTSSWGNPPCHLMWGLNAPKSLVTFCVIDPWTCEWVFHHLHKTTFIIHRCHNDKQPQLIKAAIIDVWPLQGKRTLRKMQQWPHLFVSMNVFANNYCYYTHLTCDKEPQPVTAW